MSEVIVVSLDSLLKSRVDKFDAKANKITGTIGIDGNGNPAVRMQYVKITPDDFITKHIELVEKEFDNHKDTRDENIDVELIIRNNTPFDGAARYQWDKLSKEALSYADNHIDANKRAAFLAEVKSCFMELIRSSSYKGEYISCVGDTTDNNYGNGGSEIGDMFIKTYESDFNYPAPVADKVADK